jgi:hypothetical protein
MERWCDAARAQILRNDSRSDAVPPSPARERQTRQRQRERNAGGQSGGAFAKVRPWGDRTAAETAALARLRRARAVYAAASPSPVLTTPEETQRRVDSFVNRAFFKLDAANQARELRARRDAGDVLRGGTPVNTALYRFGRHLHATGRAVAVDTLGT